MKRTVLFAALAAVALVPATSDAAPKKKERTETLSYTLPTGVTSPAVSGATCGDPVRACLNVSLGKDEKYIKFSVKDSTGLKVGIQYFAGETNDDYQSVQTICGEGKSTFKKPSMVSFRIALDNSCAGIPTQGKLTVVISNLP